MKIQSHQMLLIAREYFPSRVKEFINFKNLEMMHMSDVYRLYDKDTPFRLMLPEERLLSIHFGCEDFVQFSCGTKAFDHHKAINMLEDMGIIK